MLAIVNCSSIGSWIWQKSRQCGRWVVDQGPRKVGEVFLRSIPTVSAYYLDIKKEERIIVMKKDFQMWQEKENSQKEKKKIVIEILTREAQLIEEEVRRTDNNFKYGIKIASAILAGINISSLYYQYRNSSTFDITLSNFLNSFSILGILILNFYSDRIIATLRSKKRKEKEKEEIADNLTNTSNWNNFSSTKIREVLGDSDLLIALSERIKQSDEKIDTSEGSRLNIAIREIRSNKEERMRKKEEVCNTF